MNTDIKGYAVCLFRRNSEEPLVLTQADKFEDAKKVWNFAHEEWKNSVTEKRPFILEQPIVTAFDPSLVLEILVTPIRSQARKSSNPYERATQRHGFTEVFNNPTGTVGDLTDQGYR